MSIPQSVLDAAEKVLLRDLLDSPTFQPWLVSALANGLNTAHLTGVQADDDDQFLQFKLNQMVRTIPYDLRRECFDTTARLIRERKEKRHTWTNGTQPVSG